MVEVTTYVNSSQAVSAYQNITDAGTLLTTTNNVLDGFLGIGLWAMIIITLFVALKSRGAFNSDAFMACTIIGLIVSLLLRAMEILPDWFLYMNVVLLPIAGAVAIISGSK